MASVSHLYDGSNHTHFIGFFDALNEMILGNLLPLSWSPGQPSGDGHHPEQDDACPSWREETRGIIEKLPESSAVFALRQHYVVGRGPLVSPLEMPA